MINIAYLIGKIKSQYMVLKEGIEIKNDLFIVILIIMTGLISFGLGKLSSMEKSSNMALHSNLEIEDEDLIAKIPNTIPSTQQTAIPSNMKQGSSSDIVYASKNGKKYYFEGCSGLTKIKKENLIQFASVHEAENSGLMLASGCFH